MSCWLMQYSFFPYYTWYILLSTYRIELDVTMDSHENFNHVFSLFSKTQLLFMTQIAAKSCKSKNELGMSCVP